MTPAREQQDFLEMDLQGAEIGGHVIEGEIGHGGFGRVLRARSLADGCLAAVKILRPMFVGVPEIIKRFEREAALAARLNHPNVVRIRGYGAWSNTFYYIMDFIAGRSLWDLIYLEQGMSAARSLHLMMQCVEALERAHELGIIHRDLKPGNIMVAPSDVAILVDFGLAKDATATAITAPGSLMGTFEYMAPEQLLGQPADIRSDLYSLGLVWWQCLTARQPFTVRDKSIGLPHRRVNIAAQLPGCRPDVPRDHVSVIERMLDFYPSARYSDPGRLRADLERLRDGVAIGSTDPIPPTTPIILTPEDVARIRSGEILRDSPGGNA